MAAMQKGIRADRAGCSPFWGRYQRHDPVGAAGGRPGTVQFGIRPWFLAAGFVLTAVGVATFFAPAIMRLEDHVAEKVLVE